MIWESVERPLKIQRGSEMPSDIGEMITFYDFLERFRPIKPSLIRICEPPILSYSSTNAEGPRYYIWIPYE